MMQHTIKENIKNLTEEFLLYANSNMVPPKKTLDNVDKRAAWMWAILLNKSKNKLPTFFKHRCCFTSKSLEQSTNEQVAVFKANEVKGKILLDLTGGLGVDDWAFSKSFEKIISVEPDEELNKIARFNFLQLGAENIERITSTAENFLEIHNEKADLIYIDPDRRIAGQRKQAVEELRPNVFLLLEKLFLISEKVMIKFSPLTDINFLKKKFNCVEKIYVIALNNEVKEVLCILKNHFSAETEIEAVDIIKNGVKRFSGIIEV